MMKSKFVVARKIYKLVLVAITHVFLTLFERRQLLVKKAKYDYKGLKLQTDNAVVYT